jgi:hypothetical protein
MEVALGYLIKGRKGYWSSMLLKDCCKIGERHGACTRDQGQNSVSRSPPALRSIRHRLNSGIAELISVAIFKYRHQM